MKVLAPAIAAGLLVTLSACGGAGENDASLSNEQLVDPDDAIYGGNAVDTGEQGAPNAVAANQVSGGTGHE